jgi:predicted DNA-binding transcriptional regulator AlpA
VRQPLLSVQDLALQCQVPEKTIYAWRYRGVGPRSIRVGRYVRYRQEDVDRWIESQSSEVAR